MYGKKHSEETKRKISEIKKETSSGENNPFYGKKHTEETKRKIGEANKGSKGNCKLTIFEVIKIKKELKTKDKTTTYNELYDKLAKQYGVSIGCIRKIKTGERWEDVKID